MFSALHLVLLRAVDLRAQGIEKFGQRWRALKPQEMKDWSAPEVERVFAAMGDWREQFQEHKNHVRVHKLECYVRLWCIGTISATPTRTPPCHRTVIERRIRKRTIGYYYRNAETYRRHRFRPRKRQTFTSKHFDRLCSCPESAMCSVLFLVVGGPGTTISTSQRQLCMSLHSRLHSPTPCYHSP